MRDAIVAAAVAATFFISASAAKAEQWCGYAVKNKAFVECGYSTEANCTNSVGKGGECFIDPNYASDLNRMSPRTVAQPASTAAPTAGRG
jgi:hypothetical protein